jgi:hypothetical protein
VGREGRAEFGESHSTVEPGEPLKGQTAETLASSTVPRKLQRIADLARQAPAMAFTTLAHHMDIDWLHEALLTVGPYSCAPL